MPRYSITIKSSTDPRKRKAHWAYAATLFEAERIAERWLEKVRLTDFGRLGYDCWTVAVRHSPHRPAEVVSHGGLSD